MRQKMRAVVVDAQLFSSWKAGSLMSEMTGDYFTRVKLKVTLQNSFGAPNFERWAEESEPYP
jgi:hypothetical protein